MAAKKATKKTTTSAKPKSASEKASSRKTVAARKNSSKSGTAKASSANKSSTSKAAVKNNSLTTSTTPEENKSAESSRSMRFKKSYAILIIVVLAFAALLYFFRGLLVAAVVNGQPISRVSVVHETEKQSGKQALDTLVRNKLIEQEAGKEHVAVSDKEVNDEINTLKNNLKKQGQNMDQVLAAQGMSMNDLKELIRLDKLVGKMVGNSITISDKQVNDYIAGNKDALPQGQSDAQLKASVRDQLKQQELNTKVKTWLDDLQKKAKINYFVNY